MTDTSSDLQYPEQFFQIIAALNKGDVQYVLIGGVAMVLQGSAHLTRDIDIYYGRDPRNIEKLVSVIAPLHPRLRGLPEDIPFIFDARTFKHAINFTLMTDLGDIDLLGEIQGAPSFADVYERSETMEIDASPVHVSSIPDLITLKRVAGRPKDAAHIAELEALLHLLADQDKQ